MSPKMMRLCRLNEDKLLPKLEGLSARLTNLPMLTKDSNIDPDLPQCVPTASANDNNGVSCSESSASLDDTSSSPKDTSRRCVFGPYWKKKGGRPKQPLLLMASPDENQEDPQDLQEDPKTNADMSVPSADGNYEHLLEQKDATNVPSNAASPSSRGNSNNSRTRRRFWGNNPYFAHLQALYHQSEPSLTRCAEQGPLRKTKSAGLITRPQGSCLRKPRYSGSNNKSSQATTNTNTPTPRRSSDTSVSFSEELVQVRYLMPVLENWAPLGWSQHFI